MKEVGSAKSEERIITVGTALAALPVVIAWIYFLGRSYLEAYYSKFGVSFSFLRPDINDALLAGALGQLGVAIGLFALLFGLLLYMLAVTLVGRVVGALVNRQWAEAKRLAVNTFRPWRWVERQPGREIKKTSPTEIFIWIVLGLGVSSFLATLWGKAVASTVRNEWESKSNGTVSVFYSEGDSDIRITAHLIGCGEFACAFWTKEHIVQLPRAEILSIESSASAP